MTNNEITRAVLSTRQVNSLLSLADCDSNQPVKLSNAQIKAMRTAYLAIVAAGAEVPEEVQQAARNLKLI
jgi:hypothetical protein